MPFQFEGVPVGISLSRPMMSLSNFELTVPIKPYAEVGPVPENIQDCFEGIRRDAMEGGA